MTRLTPWLSATALGLALASCSATDNNATNTTPTLDVSNDSFNTEGMWMPEQLPELGPRLEALGLELPVESLTQLTEFPMNAVISLGGCTASFVSPQGLVATNHHCAYGSIQYNSTEDNDLLANGFYAETFNDELQAAPGSRVYVTEDVIDVTQTIRSALTADMTGFERNQAIENAEKSIVAECETTDGYRCNVYSYYGGLQYYLLKQMEIRDVRLVYAPASSIGKFGGDIDNWMWPRHTGDFSFYRAYVGVDGKPADFSEDNVPYQPKHHLQVATQGPSEHDFVMVAGYPGSTNRYRTALEVENQFNWYYPTMQKVLADWSATIGEAAGEGTDAELKYASQVAGLNNYAKNFMGMMEGYARSDLLQRKLKLETDLQAWIDADVQRTEQYATSLNDLSTLISEDSLNQERDFALNYMARSSLLGAANTLVRLAHENQKPNEERTQGYQERDLPRIEAGLQRINRRYDQAVDKAVWMFFVQNYLALPADQRVADFDSFFGLTGTASDSDILAAKLDEMYATSQFEDTDTRVALMNATPEELAASDEPFVQLAVALFDFRMAREEEARERSGLYSALRPRYMQMLIDFYGEQGLPVYPDANSTLRVTYGVVKGYTPPAGSFSEAADGNDGVDSYVPFTTLKGITAKYTGEDPFDSPALQLEQIEAKHYGRYYDEALDSVAVNYLSTVDTTGGNSGSPTMNGKGEFIGLLFDGTYDSINADWDFTSSTRSIHVDVSYMLWVMEHVDNTERLLDEMNIPRD
ncbi:S46 family peptidase [Umboniibacter marinipuniceus]|uniref:Dipeptidyl-peptidase n=1 Tax=Umboniibacter marinipuniceus TaxID=569599 RepID=A0A3M0A762_9GAMM|nr:S46 family peptidase [Umboniibacter marinipuniceus]RMA79379.1 dipeptidyl-peptidase 7 [Umboniibacter marinipuniceus]